MTKAHATNCILASRCNAVGTPACAPLCEFYVGITGRIKAAGLPSDYRLVTVASSPARESQQQVYESVDAYTATFSRQFEADGARIKSLYLYSAAPGTGKTTTAAVLLNEYIAQHYVGSLKRNRQPLQQPAYFLSVNELQQMHNKAHLPASQQTKEKLGEELIREIERAKKTPFVVLDDLAVRKATSSFLGIIYDICDYRTANSLPTIFTSNKSPNDLREFFFEEDPEGKVVDRITDMAAVLSFAGQSKRGRR